MLTVTYSYYKENYLGDTVSDSKSFDKIIKQVVLPKINQFTFGRADEVPPQDTKTIDKLRMACCAMVDIYSQHISAKGDMVGNVKSESVGPFSVTYDNNTSSKASTTEEMIDEAMLVKVRMFLRDTGLMYAGVEV